MNTCGRCKYWYDFLQYYEDPDEPDDYGFCQNKSSQDECTSIDDTCELFDIHPGLIHED